MKQFKIIFITASNLSSPQVLRRRKIFPDAPFCTLYGSANILAEIILGDLAGQAEEPSPLLPAQELAVQTPERPVTFREQIEFAASCDASVLLLGESGSGKTWTARQIHKKSSRSRQKLQEINMASLSPSLMESSLFGTTRGAFTGATESRGLFEEGNGSTIFLDEIAELPVDMQAKLLSVIENFTYRKLGSMKERHFNARFIFATNAPIIQYVEQKKFRKDLFYRINTLTINIPPLRNHMEDFDGLAHEFEKEMSVRLSQQALDCLKRYDWPGNIRELKNVIYKTKLFSDEEEISARTVGKILQAQKALGHL